MLLFAICDISHLGKNIRNALYNRKVLWISEKYVKENNLVSSEVRWEHIVKLVEFEKKMRLTNASQFFQTSGFNLLSKPRNWKLIGMAGFGEMQSPSKLYLLENNQDDLLEMPVLTTSKAKQFFQISSCTSYLTLETESSWAWHALKDCQVSLNKH